MLKTPNILGRIQTVYKKYIIFVKQIGSRVILPENPFYVSGLLDTSIAQAQSASHHGVRQACLQPMIREKTR
jgi:hypothetical protein